MVTNKPEVLFTLLHVIKCLYTMCHSPFTWAEDLSTSPTTDNSHRCDGASLIESLSGHIICWLRGSLLVTARSGIIPRFSKTSESDFIWFFSKTALRLQPVAALQKKTSETLTCFTKNPCWLLHEPWLCLNRWPPKVSFHLLCGWQRYERQSVV